MALRLMLFGVMMLGAGGWSSGLQQTLAVPAPASGAVQLPAGVAQAGSSEPGGSHASGSQAGLTSPSPAEVAGMQRKLADWGQLEYYRGANATLSGAAAGEQRVVFYGASMTENWGKNGSVFFPGKGYINRGIGGQTTAQMVVRFRQDVIDLQPAAVVILGGTNDVAGNTGPTTPEMTEGNWTSMAELARANGIRVIFASITPASEIPWRRSVHPAEKIRALNTWLKGYCASHGLVYLDYYSVLTDAEGGMQADLTVDGVHATPKGYTRMAPLAQAAIDQALAGPAPRDTR